MVAEEDATSSTAAPKYRISTKSASVDVQMREPIEEEERPEPSETCADT